MAGRGRTTFQKRQKEQVRLERRQAKAARKEARKGEEKSDSFVIEPIELNDELDRPLQLPTDLDHV